LAHGVILSSPTSAASALFQIHGSPESLTEDTQICAELAQRFADNSAEPTIILLHRPDEMQTLLPQLREVLSSATVPFGLCFLGDLHIDDDFFDALYAVRRTMPHGFFSSKAPAPSQPYLIGSHTRWGPMRSLSDALRLMLPALHLVSPLKLHGYIGGDPSLAYSKSAIAQAISEVGYSADEFDLTDWPGTKLNNARSRPTIYLGSDYEAVTNQEIQAVHFNVQLFHMRGLIRSGENSGSLHSSPSIPVIIEMNGAERTEDLAVVKVLRGTSAQVVSCDFQRAAAAIADIINSNETEKLLRHNQARAQLLTPEFVAGKYLDLFDELSS